MMSHFSFNLSSQAPWATPTRVVVLLLVALASCGRVRVEEFERQGERGALPVEMDAPLASPGYGRVHLHRRQSFLLVYGNQFNFSVEFRKDGTAALERTSADSVLEYFVGNIGHSEYRRLCELLFTSCVESLDDNYYSGQSEGVNFTLILHDDQGAQLKHITEHGQSGPMSFWAAKRSIEGIIARTEWEPVVEHAFSTDSDNSPSPQEQD